MQIIIYGVKKKAKVIYGYYYLMVWIIIYNDSMG